MIMSANSTNTTTELQKMSIPTGLGLLTTVAQLPPKYKIRYLARTALNGLETPLDLTVKQDVCAFIQNSTNLKNFQINDIIKIQSVTTEQNNSKINDNNIQYNNSNNMKNNSNNKNSINEQHPITPPPSPPKKRFRDDGYQSSDSELQNNINAIQTTTNITESYPSSTIEIITQTTTQTTKSLTTEIPITNEQKTPTKPIKTPQTAPRTGKSNLNTSREKKSAKAIRKLKFDEDTSSPVSGTIIRPLEEITNSGEDIQSGDIDPEYNIVEVTEEAKQELAQIKNIIGSYTCKLCRIEFEDAFGLARHRCSCIVLLEYRCPECGKRFNCPANLASHRRWHKPKDEILKKQNENSENDQLYPCLECGKNFKRQAYLRKHLTTHKHKEESTKRKATKVSGGGGGNTHQGNKRKIQKLNDLRISSSSLSTSSLSSRTTSASILSEEEEEDTREEIEIFSAHQQNHNSNSSHHISTTNSINDDSYQSRQSITINNSIINSPNYANDNYINQHSSSSTTATFYTKHNNMAIKYDSEYSETRSDCSSPGRLQIIDDHHHHHQHQHQHHNHLTEEENIAAAALAHLRNGPSVIQHTTATMAY